METVTFRGKFYNFRSLLGFGKAPIVDAKTSSFKEF